MDALDQGMHFLRFCLPGGCGQLWLPPVAPLSAEDHSLGRGHTVPWDRAGAGGLWVASFVRGAPSSPAGQAVTPLASGLWTPSPLPTAMGVLFSWGDPWVPGVWLVVR